MESTFVNEVRSASNQCTYVLMGIETCDWLARFEKPRDLHTAFYRVRPDPLANHTPLNARGSGVSRLPFANVLDPHCTIVTNKVNLTSCRYLGNGHRKVNRLRSTFSLTFFARRVSTIPGYRSNHFFRAADVVTKK